MNIFVASICVLFNKKSISPFFFFKKIGTQLCLNYSYFTYISLFNSSVYSRLNCYLSRLNWWLQLATYDLILIYNLSHYTALINSNFRVSTSWSWKSFISSKNTLISNYPKFRLILFISTLVYSLNKLCKLGQFQSSKLTLLIKT